MNAEDWIKRAETDLRVAKKLLDAKEETWVKTDKEFEELSKLDVEYLTVYATEVRYPGFYEPAEEVIEAIEK